MSPNLNRLSEQFVVSEAFQKKEKDWYVFYTCPRSEKLVYQELVRREYEPFLPMTRTLRVWKNRQKKWIDSVLFPSYIFVNTKESELYNIIGLPKVATFIHVAGKPTIVSKKVIEGIKKMLLYEKEISVINNFIKGDLVRITQGPLLGHEGILVKQNGRSRFGIQLKEINQTVFIDIGINALEKIKTNVY